MIGAAVNILAFELGIFSLKIRKNLGFDEGNGTIYWYQLYKGEKMLYTNPGQKYSHE
jgi:hypothetical protein